MKPKVSIIVVNYNGSYKILKFIDSLMQTEYTNKNIIIIDNASTDNSGADLKNKWRKESAVEVLLNRENIGYTAGCNRGIKRAISKKSKYFIISNFDVEIINYKIIQQMVDFMEKSEQVGIVGPKVYIYQKGNIQNTVFFFPTLFAYIRDWYKRNMLKIQSSYDIRKPTKVDAVNGVFAMYRAEMFNEIGLFDPYINMYGDELDIGIRAKRNGWTVYALSHESIVHHPEGNYEFFNIRNFLNKRNKIYLANKFYGKHTSFCWFLLSLLNIMVRIVVLECKNDVERLKKGKKFLNNFVKEVFEIWKYDFHLNP